MASTCLRMIRCNQRRRSHISSLRSLLESTGNGPRNPHHARARIGQHFNLRISVPFFTISTGLRARALRDPSCAAGVKFEDAALAEIFRLTKGYPYFLQEWGYQAWNVTAASPISLQDVKAATGRVVSRLDQNFFRVRFDRLTPSEKNFLRAMAELGAGAHRTGDIAVQLGVRISTLSPVRAKLIRKGMIYSPAHGDMAFTGPLFDEFHGSGDAEGQRLGRKLTTFPAGIDAVHCAFWRACRSHHSRRPR